MELNTERIITGLEQEKTYRKKWRIVNFDVVVTLDSLLSAQRIEMKTVQESGTTYTWLIGLRRFKCGDASNIFIYCQLCEISGNADEWKVEAFFHTNVRSINHGVLNEEKTVQIYSLDDNTEHTGGHVLFPQGSVTRDMLHVPDRSVIINVQLTVLRRVNAPTLTRISEKMELESDKILRANMLKLLKDKNTADVKIVTKDGKECRVHKMILKMYPVFQLVLNSNTSKSKTGVLTANICRKTMKIILRFLYTGELLPTWKDSDTVGEFTYAAGKYKLNGILEMLDNTLGGPFSDGYSTSLLVSLLKLSKILSLTNAKERLQKQIDVSMKRDKSKRLLRNKR